MKRICGIDEAGRGSLIGPLLVAGVCITPADIPLLRKLGVKDSKLLSHQRREEIFESFQQHEVQFYAVAISPQRIDEVSLNDLEIQEAASIINHLRPHEAYVDVPARAGGIDRYCQQVKRSAEYEVHIVGGNRFDILYEVVSAASIVAKVMRDRAVGMLRAQYGDFGSGYPNARTMAYVKDHFEALRPIIRMKWKNVSALNYQPTQEL